MTCLLFLRTAPPAPVIPADVHGQLVAGISACYAGPLAAGARVMRPLKAFGAPLADTIAPKPFTAHQAFLDAGQPAGRRYCWKSEYLASLSPAVGAALGEHFSRVTSPCRSRASNRELILDEAGHAARVPDHAETTGGPSEAPTSIIPTPPRWWRERPLPPPGISGSHSAGPCVVGHELADAL